MRVGIETAKALAVTWKVPLVPVDHLEGHVFANFLTESAEDGSGISLHRALPALCLIVSGGHTELVRMDAPGRYRILGATRDDAAGEAFDKAAKLLGLPYPGGPMLAARAVGGNRRRFGLPRPMQNSGDDDFSFSGLKTAMRTLVEDGKQQGSLQKEEWMKDACASFEEAVVDVLISKTLRAAEREVVHSVLLCGGVGANTSLRERLVSIFSGTPVVVSLPQKKFTTDNAAMIGAAGLSRLAQGHFARDPFAVDAHPAHRLGGAWEKFDV